MSSRSRRHASEEHDNPAWPGLVDLFAFGMVIILLLWAQAASRTPSAGTETGPASGESRIKERLTEISGVLRAQLGGKVKDVSYAEDPQRVDIRTHIRFVQKGTSSPDQQEEVRSVCRTVIGFVAENDDTLLVISGKADPRPFRKEDPPRDNIELSALRAAEVSRIVFNSAATDKLQERISVRGLGDRGQPLVGAVSPAWLEQLRTVTFEVHVNKAMLVESGKLAQAPSGRGQP